MLSTIQKQLPLFLITSALLFTQLPFVFQAEAKEVQTNSYFNGTYLPYLQGKT